MWIVDWWKVRGRKIQTVRNGERKRVLREKTKEHAKAMKEKEDEITALKDKFRKEIVKKDNEIERLEEDHRKELQKRDKKVSDKLLSLATREDKLKAKEDKAVSLEETLVDHIAEADMVINILNQTLAFQRQQAGVLSGLGHRLEHLRDRIKAGHKALPGGIIKKLERLG